jgi:hypothetical protein
MFVNLATIHIWHWVLMIKPLVLMTWCCLHYIFLLSCVESLDCQSFVMVLQTYLTYSQLVIRLCNHGFEVVSWLTDLSNSLKLLMM